MHPYLKPRAFSNGEVPRPDAITPQLLTTTTISTSIPSIINIISIATHLPPPNELAPYALSIAAHEGTSTRVQARDAATEELGSILKYLGDRRSSWQSRQGKWIGWNACRWAG